MYINFESKKTFLNFLKNVNDNEKNDLRVHYDLYRDIDSSNNIKFIIEELLKYKKIYLYLFIPYTNINKFPKNIFNLTNLRYLDICKTNIDHIPFSICKLQKLDTLWMYETNFKKIPLILCDLQNLQVIYIFAYKNDINFLKKKRLLFRLYFIICKSFILKILKYKILQKLIKY
jgi:hypothetical protein